MPKNKFLSFLIIMFIVVAIGCGINNGTANAANKPNILVIFGDDVGMWNISAYHRGMMGGSTPNIDRIAAEGAIFTDYYAQQSCTAGRSAFILGDSTRFGRACSPWACPDPHSAFRPRTRLWRSS